MEKLKQIIVIPAYKPTNVLCELVKELMPCFDKIVIVDDGGGSAYEDVFKTLEELGCTVLKHCVNLGKGAALKTAFNYCVSLGENAAAGVVTVDADGQHKPDDIIKICSVMDREQGKIVLGYRCFDDRSIPFRSRVGNKLSRGVYKWLCGLDVQDTQTGLRGIPYEFLPIACAVEGERYEYETNVLLAAKDNRIAFSEIPIETVYEENNPSSHFNPFKDSIKIYSVILKYSMSSLLSVVIDYIVFGIVTGLGINIMIATYAARVCSSFINFIINRNVVFKYKGSMIVQLGKYILLVLFSGTVSGFLVSKLSSLCGINIILLKVVVESILYFFNYYIQRTFVFAEK